MDKNKENSALKALGSLPKVGNGNIGFFGSGWDVSLSLAYNNAQEIALGILKDLSKEEFNDLFWGLYDVFEHWKNEYGVYPPITNRRQGLLEAFSGDKKEIKQISAVEREKQLEQEGSDKALKPWECCNDATTPIRLFQKLSIDGYSYLEAFTTKKKYATYENILAMCILITHDSDKEYQSSECIETAMFLAKILLDTQKAIIKNTIPLAFETIKKRKANKVARAAKKQETSRKVLEAYNRIKEENPNAPSIQKLISLDTGVSQPTVSKRLQELGLNKQYQKKLS